MRRREVVNGDRNDKKGGGIEMVKRGRGNGDAPLEWWKW